MSKKIAILGSTGSIGTQTLDVISHYPEQFTVEGLAAGMNIELLEEQIHQFHPRKVSVATKDLADRLKLQIPSHVEVLYGNEGMLEISAGTDAEFVMSALVGSVGLQPTLAAIEAGKDIGLANKETLVTAGHLVTEQVKKHHVKLLPVDSEHSAVFQCLNGEKLSQVSKIFLTASGGAFRDRSREQLHNVSIEEALKHPNWSMGAKITIDSATMANKGLEVMEAHWLFHLPYEQIEVLIHPESIIHSMVEYVDNSVIAQLGNPDMRIPIQYALTYPDRIPNPSQPLNLAQIGSLHFKAADFKRYPCLQMAFDSGKAGGTAPTVFNAANEEAVARFLRKEIRFLDIEAIIEDALSQHQVSSNPDLEHIMEVDLWARAFAANWKN
ncbi:MAG: 1-deoxy-D-xylulose-5-phosphate reductoisomerase [Paenibacillus sp. RIFOXYA1_FULL_44_5]|nr:MAG: 1-deoxy-D-xylulose-5-phosphate reductoisomerase [Paenibacillus sp. RIFOXYA1_FULL_44_5]